MDAKKNQSCSEGSVLCCGFQAWLKTFLQQALPSPPAFRGQGPQLTLTEAEHLPGQQALNLWLGSENISQVPSFKRFRVGFWKLKGQVTCHTQAILASPPELPPNTRDCPSHWVQEDAWGSWLTREGSNRLKIMGQMKCQ